MPQPRDMPHRDSAPPPVAANPLPSGPHPQSQPPQQLHSARPPVDDLRPRVHPRPNHESQPPRQSSEVWAGAISRLQTQVSYNTSMHESHRRQVADIEQAVGRLQQEMGNVGAIMNELRNEIRGRPPNADGAPGTRHDSGDLDLLATQVASITTKANEVDGLKMQLELMKNRLKRFEEHTASPSHTSHPPPPSGPPSAHPAHASPAIAKLRPGPSPSSHAHDQAQHPPPPPPPHHHPGQPLPPMRTASVASPREDRPPGFTGPPQHGQQNTGPYRPGPDTRSQSNEPGPNSAPPRPPGSFRPTDPALPPPSALSGWRPAESFTGQPGAPPPQNQPLGPGAGPVRPHDPNADPQASGWAAVNQPLKRNFEEQRPPYDAPPGSGSPKRPKLAPIMPRSNYGDEGHPPPPANFGYGNAPMAPDSFRSARSRAPSDDMHHNPPSATANAFRFVTATAPASVPHPEHDMWRTEHDRHDGTMGRGRGRGRGSRGRGRGSRGGRGGLGQLTHGPDGHEVARPQEPAPAAHMSPNGYYRHIQQPPSPRSEMLRRPAAPMERDHMHNDSPLTPLHSMHDQFAVQDPSGSNKKSRTKPIRNSEGVLIRKDGRPDMRSVSSANNLRKVHAKKEAERVDGDGRTPTSTRSFAGGDSNSERGDTRSGTPVSGMAGDPRDDEPEGANGTEAADMHHNHSPYQHQSHAPSSLLADRFFSRHEPESAPARDEVPKKEVEEEAAHRVTERETGSIHRDDSEANNDGDADSGDNIVARQPSSRIKEKLDVVMKDSEEAKKSDTKVDSLRDEIGEKKGAEPAKHEEHKTEVVATAA